MYRAVQAYEELKEKGGQVRVINVSCVNELDREAALNAAKTGVIITYEDHHIRTGLGSLIANFLADQGVGIRFRKLGVTHYGSSGKPDEFYRMQGLDVGSLVQAVMDEIKKR